MLSMKYAIFTVSTPHFSPEEAVRRIHAEGYDGIEWRVQDDDPTVDPPTFWRGNRATLPLTEFETDAPAWKRLTEASGLAVPAIATYVACDDTAAAQRAMRGASLLGAPALRIQVPRYDGSTPYTRLWEAAREHYGTIADLAARHGVKALVELHHRTIVPSGSAARRFLDGLDPANVGAIYDAGNMVIEGWEHPRTALEALGPYLAHVHLKNARWIPGETLADGTIRWESAFCPIPEGVADMRSVMRSLRQVGYNGWITFEDFSTERTIEENLARNLAYIRSIEEEIAAAV
jgi:sugar phosphate isomerase/epimerase